MDVDPAPRRKARKFSFPCGSWGSWNGAAGGRIRLEIEPGALRAPQGQRPDRILHRDDSHGELE